MSTRPRFPDRIPQKRLIVFAGVSSHKPRYMAMLNRKVEAVMASFEIIKSGAWWATHARAVFDTWPHYRYLDSGAFTFLRQGEGTRIKNQMKATKEVNQTEEQRLAAVRGHFDLYLNYLKAHQEDWDFIFDMDVDTISFPGISGVELTHEFRAQLKQVVGERLLPVWHPIAGQDSWKSLCQEYDYLAIGSDMDPKSRELRYVIDYAHSQGVKIHGLGTSKVEILQVTPFDTVDSTTWLSSVRFGQYAGWRFTGKESSKIGRREFSKAQSFRKIVTELGYDPELLLEEGCSQEVKYEVALALFQKRQDEAPEIKAGGGIKMADLFG